MKKSSAFRLARRTLILSVGLAGCAQRADVRESVERRATAAIDSARVTRAALDSANHASRFISEVLRYETHGDSVRIVTMPDQRKNPMLDGMAVIWVRRDGRILRLTWTDSA